MSKFITRTIETCDRDVIIFNPQTKVSRIITITAFSDVNECRENLYNLVELEADEVIVGSYKHATDGVCKKYRMLMSDFVKYAEVIE